jgi:PAS domain S-box-containing protein
MDVLTEGLAEQLPAITVVRDGDDRVVYVSPQVEQMLGIPPARYATMSVEELLHPDDLVRIEAERRRLRAGEIDCWQMELRIRDGRGGYRTVVDHHVRVGETHTRGVAIDITELREAERRARARGRAGDVRAVLRRTRRLMGELSPATPA